MCWASSPVSLILHSVFRSYEQHSSANSGFAIASMWMVLFITFELSATVKFQRASGFDIPSFPWYGSNRLTRLSQSHSHWIWTEEAKHSSIPYPHVSCLFILHLYRYFNLLFSGLRNLQNCINSASRVDSRFANLKYVLQFIQLSLSWLINRGV